MAIDELHRCGEALIDVAETLKELFDSTDEASAPAPEPAPETKPITLEKLLSEDQGVPIGLGELFSKTVNKLNTLGGREELRFLLEQLSEENRIQLFASFGYAKNSAGQSPNSEGSRQNPLSSS
jgi:hypothetical protein